MVCNGNFCKLEVKISIYPQVHIYRSSSKKCKAAKIIRPKKCSAALNIRPKKCSAALNIRPKKCNAILNIRLKKCIIDYGKVVVCYETLGI